MGSGSDLAPASQPHGRQAVRARPLRRPGTGSPGAGQFRPHDHGRAGHDPARAPADSLEDGLAPVRPQAGGAPYRARRRPGRAREAHQGRQAQGRRHRCPLGRGRGRAAPGLRQQGPQAPAQAPAPGRQEPRRHHRSRPVRIRGRRRDGRARSERTGARPRRQRSRPNPCVPRTRAVHGAHSSRGGEAASIPAWPIPSPRPCPRLPRRARAP